MHQKNETPVHATTTKSVLSKYDTTFNFCKQRHAPDPPFSSSTLPRLAPSFSVPPLTSQEPTSPFRCGAAKGKGTGQRGHDCTTHAFLDTVTSRPCGTPTLLHEPRPREQYAGFSPTKVATHEERTSYTTMIGLIYNSTIYCELENLSSFYASMHKYHGFFIDWSSRVTKWLAQRDCTHNK